MRSDNQSVDSLPAWPSLRAHLQSGGAVWLFLDFDGTLAPIAPTPDEARLDVTVLSVLLDLVQAGQFRVAIVSGRALASLRGLVPVPELILAGVYGAEMLIDGIVISRAGLSETTRPVIEAVRQAWITSVGSRNGFLVEDKGCAVALHARWASEAESQAVLETARTSLSNILPETGFRILGGDRFLEVAPQIANKGWAVQWLLNCFPLPRAIPVYVGDDDKDAEAFDVIGQQGGWPITVGDRLPAALTADRLASPSDVHQLLRAMAQATRR